MRQDVVGHVDPEPPSGLMNSMVVSVRLKKTVPRVFLMRDILFNLGNQNVSSVLYPAAVFPLNIWTKIS